MSLLWPGECILGSVNKYVYFTTLKRHTTKKHMAIKSIKCIFTKSTEIADA